jgi:hypothetical protein
MVVEEAMTLTARHYLDDACLGNPPRFVKHESTKESSDWKNS